MRKILVVGVKWGQDPGHLSDVIRNGRLHEVRPLAQGLVRGLEALGHRPGEAFDMDYLVDEPPRLRAGIRDALKASKPDTIFPISSSAVRAAAAATAAIPIVFPNISDPIEQGVVRTCGAPRKNATGLRTALRHTAPDCLELFKATVPSLTQVCVLFQPGFHAPQVKRLKKPVPKAMKTLELAAGEAKVRLRLLPVRTRDDVAESLAPLSQAGPAGRPRVGVLVHPDELVVSEGLNIIQQAHSKGIPTFFPLVEFVHGEPHSALGAYGIPPDVTGAAAAGYVHKVFAGARPGDLPVKRLGGFEWAVNTAVARALNISLPDRVLKAADRVV